MTVSFNEISKTIRTPQVLMEFDSSHAVVGPQLVPFKVLLLGTRRSGTVAALVPTRIQNPDQGAQFFGAGSQLACAIAAYFAANDETEVWACAVAAPSGTPATGTFTIVAAPTATGTAVFYVGGRRYPCAITLASTSTSVGADLAAQVNADTFAPYTATPSAGVVTISARQNGVYGNDLDLRVSYQDGEALPAGVSVTVAAMSGGTGDPSYSAVWAVLGDSQYQAIVMPATDATNLTSLETELRDRQSAQRKIGGYGYSGVAGSLSTVSTLGNGRNSNRAVLVPTNKSPTPPWEFCAAYVGAIMPALAEDPARPLQTLPVLGVLPPAPADRWTQAERNSLLYSGVSTFTVQPGGLVQVERVISTYKLNPAGGVDSSWLDVNVGYTLDLLRYDFQNRMTSRYPRHKLASDEGNYGSGQAIVTPSQIRAELVSLARGWEEQGWVEGVEQFKRDLVVERSATDPSRVDVVLPPDLVNGLRILAARATYLL